MLADGGDQLALAHARGTLDAKLASQRTEVGEHHRGQRGGAVAGGDHGRRRGLGGGRSAGAAETASEIGEFTGFGSSTSSLLPSAVMRSVSVTDFLSFPR